MWPDASVTAVRSVSPESVHPLTAAGPARAGQRGGRGCHPKANPPSGNADHRAATKRLTVGVGGARSCPSTSMVRASPGACGGTLPEAVQHERLVTLWDPARQDRLFRFATDLLALPSSTVPNSSGLRRSARWRWASSPLRSPRGMRRSTPEWHAGFRNPSRKPNRDRRVPVRTAMGERCRRSLPG